MSEFDDRSESLEDDRVDDDDNDDDDGGSVRPYLYEPMAEAAALPAANAGAASLSSVNVSDLSSW